MAEKGGADTDSNDVGCLEDILQRHKKEKKALQGEIQRLKHAIPKGDKKRKKEVTEQIAKLEAELEKKQKEEVEQFNSTQSEKKGGVSEITEGAQNLTTENFEGENTAPVPKKTSKAQKRREKKAEKGREREERIREQELLNLQGDRHLEAKKLKEKLSPLNLTVHQIHSDGNCLYNALAHQLELRGIEESNESLRQKTANYMRAHPDEYLPFLSKEDTGDMYTSDEFQEYCTTIETTTVWGGQLELRALADILRVPIKVLQGVGTDLILGEEYSAPPLILLYYRHALGLGEHYNSVRDKGPDDSEEEADGS